MYLKVQLPLPVNSNPGMVFPRQAFPDQDAQLRWVWEADPTKMRRLPKTIVALDIFGSYNFTAASIERLSLISAMMILFFYNY